MILPVILGLCAYLLGSIPTAVWFGKRFYGIDVREHGSGNAGATNTLRVLGNKAGFTVLIIDALKGYAAASLVFAIQEIEHGSNTWLVYQIIFGALAVIGHIYPVFAGFKGGKGIATLLGIVIAINYQLALLCFIVFVAVVLITRYISLGSMLSALVSPAIAYYIQGKQITALFYFCIVVSVLVVYTHRTNIKRLQNGSENRFSFKKKTTQV
jgi:glycerol-3-phosphate acyltransferase PlsY